MYRERACELYTMYEGDSNLAGCTYLVDSYQLHKQIHVHDIDQHLASLVLLSYANSTCISDQSSCSSQRGRGSALRTQQMIENLDNVELQLFVPFLQGKVQVMAQLSNCLWNRNRTRTGSMAKLALARALSTSNPTRALAYATLKNDADAKVVRGDANQVLRGDHLCTRHSRVQQYVEGCTALSEAHAKV